MVQKPGQKPVITMAREAVVRAEDSRVIALKRELAEHEEQERQAALARENAAKAQAELEARQRAQAEEEARAQTARRMQADADRRAAEKAKAEAEAATAEAQRQMALAERAKADAEAAKQAALEQQRILAEQADRARQAAADSDRLRQKAEQDQAQLRAMLLDQFNQILQTRDTARGLIVNMSDVLFDSGRYTLKPGTKEKLARLSGIVLGHPGLRLEVEGHTDSVGGDEYNMRLSENRAFAVRDYLISQGINSDYVAARGFGKTMPVADNNTSAGRQANRRVEMIISGEIIGTSLTSTRTGSQNPPVPPRQ
jgi:outer membrane protein OmpA-like peptidoglycan-associated protein